MPRSTAARSATPVPVPAPPATAAPGPARGLVAAIALAVAVPAGSLYLAQPLVGSIGPALGMSPGWAGAAVTATFLGYALGLVLVVPLGDVLENRGLALRLLGANAVAAGAAAAAPGPAAFLAAALLLGASCSVIQVLVALAAHLAPPERRGRVVGDVMSGLMLGILAARPISIVVAGAWGWRSAYAAWAALALGAALPLRRRLPRWRGSAGPGYLALLRSLAALAAAEAVLRRRALGSALSMAAFGAFWATVPLVLAAAPFRLGPRGIALVALAGVSGAAVAPLAGRAGDRGWNRPASALALAAVTGAMALAGAARAGWLGQGAALAVLVLAAGVLDAGVIADQALARHALSGVHPEARGRLNGLYTGTFFLGAAAGSAIGVAAYARAGWGAVAVLATACGLAALAVVSLPSDRPAPR